MVKVREFCCGCSLRSGTFTIAWSLLIFSTLLLITSINGFFSLRRRFIAYQHYDYSYPETENPSPYILAYDVIRTIVGITVSTTALCALHKNKIILLNGLYWYLCYMVVSFIVSDIVLIFKPDWEKKLGETNPILKKFNHTLIDHVLMFEILYLFITGMIAYFTLIVKSYRDYSLRNEAQNVEFVGPDATTVGYIAA